MSPWHCFRDRVLPQCFNPISIPPPLLSRDLHPTTNLLLSLLTLLSLLSSVSIPRAEDAELDEGLAERLRILDDAAALKKSAADYSHPEVGVTSTDGACFGRNYFNRYSAPETEDDEFADERAEIMEETAVLKKLAAD
jgi:hypothetical protein